ncbi:hypothetical protein PTSG_05679 [Salpingoeca rosetta]|uniref:Macro domain-containing protein n=1 Tax=Salpingoeca rosetta (strain ATCC 50818 / BSB-021) TaxID=946362 RepID=F2UBW8_SALR5|nr:uncharacterized protein PTSG_05679 [Salpingoeca rosetta]EGD73984.1 hypothetical protein PTSG_05679 [Salpingoeca rosetta]|eukprot:XP_004993547.1 hypothetical protein PTSG_05679 [Salpingoeca rosetta]
MEVIHTAVSDVLLMHAHPNFHLATFQVASQFNCLEFPSYDVIPEEGIKYYIDDPTQGPACSLAAAPGTLFRNYFVQVDPASPNVGQRQRRQINNLAGVERLLHTSDPKTWFWRVSNGYTIMKRKRLPKLAQILEEEPQRREQIVEHLRVGVQLGTQVVFRSRNGDTFHLLPRTSKQLVNQVFCSAMSLHPDVVHDASCIAPLVLRACYEATIAQAILAAQRNNWEHGAANVVLTFVGGGAFGNDIEWIVDAIARACATFAAFPLKVYVAHYRAIDFGIEAMINSRIDAYLQQNASHGEHKCVHITRGDWQDGPVARTSSAPEATSTAFATDVAPMVTAARAVDDLAISTTSSGSTGRSGGRTVLKVTDSHVMDDDDDDDDDDHDDDDDRDHVGDVGDDDGTAFIHTDAKRANLCAMLAMALMAFSSE